MHNAPGYVSQKMREAVSSLCSSRKWSRRLGNAGLALVSLNADDLDGELGDDLRFVLGWTAGNIIGGNVQKLPRGLAQRRLIETMLHILLETDRIEQTRMYGDPPPDAI